MSYTQDYNVFVSSSAPSTISNAHNYETGYHFVYTKTLSGLTDLYSCSYTSQRNAQNSWETKSWLTIGC